MVSFNPLCRWHSGEINKQFFTLVFSGRKKARSVRASVNAVLQVQGITPPKVGSATTKKKRSAEDEYAVPCDRPVMISGNCVLVN